MGIVKKDINGAKIRCLISSTNLLESVYDTENKDLIITFRAGRVYKYKNVDPKIYNQFELSESHGKTFHQIFKSLPTTRLNDVDTNQLLMELSAKS
jgi:hypothetical protein